MIALLEVKKEDVRGNTVVLHQDISKSFLLGFVGLMVRSWAAGQTESVKAIDTNVNDVNNTSRREFYCCVGGIGTYYSAYGTVYTDNNDLGIVVGDGTGSFDTEAFILGSKIDHGRGAGELEYFGTIAGRISSLGSNPFSFDLEAIFRNSSGGSVTVNEVGIYSVGNVTSNNKRSYCILRDNVTPIPVADGEYLKVKYTLQISV